MLRGCRSALCTPLSLIFRESLQSSTLPLAWKHSLAVPIFKKGSRLEPLNYRPISLTSVPCKILEKIICAELYKYLDDGGVLLDDQFGFRPGRSTEDQLLLMYDDVTRWVDSGSVVVAVLFDFSKAFDVVSHCVLLEKLSSLGVRDPLLGWIEHFLRGRIMQVSLGNSRSSPK